MNLIGISSELFLSILSLLILSFSVFMSEKYATRFSNRFALLGIIICIPLVYFTNNLSGSIFLNSYIYDHLSQFTKILILLGTLFTLVISYKSLKNEGIDFPEFPVLIIFSVIGMLLMTSSNDLITMYMAIELQSLPLYILAALKRDNLKSTEAGLKYFVLGALSSGILLYGMSLVYGSVGSTMFYDISISINEEISLTLLIGIIFILSGLAFKISAVPFHMWTPDVYEGAPTSVTTFFAIVPKIAAITLLIRICHSSFGNIFDQWQQIIIFISILSMLLGSVAAIFQTNIKRLIAYSSIAHVGFALVGLAAGNDLGLASVLIYMTIYVFMNIAAFCIILSLKRDGQFVEEIEDLSGLFKYQPFLAISFLVILFSMAGIPPLAGFFGKWMIFSSAVNSGLIYLAIIGVLSSVIGAFYYIRLIKIMFFDEIYSEIDKLDNRALLITLYLMTFIIITFGIYLNWFYDISIFVTSSI